MKGLIFALLLVFSCILLAFWLRPDPSIFMAGHDVASGDYYLTLRNGSVLIDDPEILKKYQKQVEIRKANKKSICSNPLEVVAFNIFCLSTHYTEDTSLKLMHREKGLIRGLEAGQTYDMPEAMQENQKVLGEKKSGTIRKIFCNVCSSLNP